MTCANPACGTEALYLRSGGIYSVDFLGADEHAGECQNLRRRVIWLCDACTSLFAVETWRPPGQQVRPSGSLPTASPRVRSRKAPAENWS
ncbi:MAG: hypothetical protein WBD98_12525 [Acidobacteriaceae bacterium]|jgi:hypothetical protein